MAKTFQIKPSLLKLLEDHCQFFGLTTDDHHAHLSCFLKLYEFLKIDGFTKKAMKPKFFPFCFGMKVRFGYIVAHPESIETWDKLK